MAYHIGDYIKFPLRASAVLTNAYVTYPINETLSDGTTGIFDCSGFNQLLVYTNFTIGSLTSASIKVEFSADNVTWYQETLLAISGGTSTDSLGVHLYGASGNYRLALPVADRYIRVSITGTGTVTNSLAVLDAILARV